MKTSTRVDNSIHICAHIVNYFAGAKKSNLNVIYFTTIAKKLIVRSYLHIKLVNEEYNEGLVVMSVCFVSGS